MASLSQYSVSTDIQDSDFQRFAEIEDEAFEANQLIGLIFSPAALHDSSNTTTTNDTKNALGGAATTRSMQDRRANALREIKATDPTVHFEKALGPDGREIVGWAKWQLYVPPHTGPQPLEPMTYPPGANLALGDHFFQSMLDVRNEYMGDRSYFFLGVLVVAPQHQRRGLGRFILESVLARADREGVECWLDASPEGKGLYEKLGWREVGRLEIDLGAWGGKAGETEVIVHMARQPKREESKQ